MLQVAVKLAAQPRTDPGCVCDPCRLPDAEVPCHSREDGGAVSEGKLSMEWREKSEPVVCFKTGSGSVGQAGNPPASVSQVLVLEECATTFSFESV